MALSSSDAGNAAELGQEAVSTEGMIAAPTASICAKRMEDIDSATVENTSQQASQGAQQGAKDVMPAVASESAAPALILSPPASSWATDSESDSSQDLLSLLTAGVLSSKPRHDPAPAGQPQPHVSDSGKASVTAESADSAQNLKQAPDLARATKGASEHAVESIAKGVADYAHPWEVSSGSAEPPDAHQSMEMPAEHEQSPGNQGLLRAAGQVGTRSGLDEEEGADVAAGPITSLVVEEIPARDLTIVREQPESRGESSHSQDEQMEAGRQDSAVQEQPLEGQAQEQKLPAEEKLPEDDSEELLHARLVAHVVDPETSSSSSSGSFDAFEALLPSHRPPIPESKAALEAVVESLDQEPPLRPTHPPLEPLKITDKEDPISEDPPPETRQHHGGRTPDKEMGSVPEDTLESTQQAAQRSGRTEVDPGSRCHAPDFTQQPVQQAAQPPAAPEVDKVSESHSEHSGRAVSERSGKDSSMVQSGIAAQDDDDAKTESASQLPGPDEAARSANPRTHAESLGSLELPEVRSQLDLPTRKPDAAVRSSQDFPQMHSKAAERSGHGDPSVPIRAAEQLTAGVSHADKSAAATEEAPVPQAASGLAAQSHYEPDISSDPIEEEQQRGSGSAQERAADCRKGSNKIGLADSQEGTAGEEQPMASSGNAAGESTGYGRTEAAQTGVSGTGEICATPENTPGGDSAEEAAGSQEDADTPSGSESSKEITAERDTSGKASKQALVHLPPAQRALLRVSFQPAFVEAALLAVAAPAATDAAESDLAVAAEQDSKAPETEPTVQAGREFEAPDGSSLRSPFAEDDGQARSFPGSGETAGRSPEAAEPSGFRAALYPLESSESQGAPNSPEQPLSGETDSRGGQGGSLSPICAQSERHQALSQEQRDAMLTVDMTKISALSPRKKMLEGSAGSPVIVGATLAFLNAGAQSNGAEAEAARLIDKLMMDREEDPEPPPQGPSPEAPQGPSPEGPEDSEPPSDAPSQPEDPGPAQGGNAPTSEGPTQSPRDKKPPSGGQSDSPESAHGNQAPSGEVPAQPVSGKRAQASGGLRRLSSSDSAPGRTELTQEAGKEATAEEGGGEPKPIEPRAQPRGSAGASDGFPAQVERTGRKTEDSSANHVDSSGDAQQQAPAPQDHSMAAEKESAPLSEGVPQDESAPLDDILASLDTGATAANQTAKAESGSQSRVGTLSSAVHDSLLQSDPVPQRAKGIATSAGAGASSAAQQVSLAALSRKDELSEAKDCRPEAMESTSETAQPTPEDNGQLSSASRQGSSPRANSPSLGLDAAALLGLAACSAAQPTAPPPSNRLAGGGSPTKDTLAEARQAWRDLAANVVNAGRPAQRVVPWACESDLDISAGNDWTGNSNDDLIKQLDGFGEKCAEDTAKLVSQLETAADRTVSGRSDAAHGMEPGTALRYSSECVGRLYEATDASDSESPEDRLAADNLASGSAPHVPSPISSLPSSHDSHDSLVALLTNPDLAAATRPDCSPSSSAQTVQKAAAEGLYGQLIDPELAASIRPERNPSGPTQTAVRTPLPLSPELVTLISHNSSPMTSAEPAQDSAVELQAGWPGSASMGALSAQTATKCADEDLPGKLAKPESPPRQAASAVVGSNAAALQEEPGLYSRASGLRRVGESHARKRNRTPLMPPDADPGALNFAARRRSVPLVPQLDEEVVPVQLAQGVAPRLASLGEMRRAMSSFSSIAGPEGKGLSRSELGFVHTPIPVAIQHPATGVHTVKGNQAFIHSSSMPTAGKGAESTIHHFQAEPASTAPEDSVDMWADLLLPDSSHAQRSPDTLRFAVAAHPAQEQQKRSFPSAQGPSTETAVSYTQQRSSPVTTAKATTQQESFATAQIVGTAMPAGGYGHQRSPAVAMQNTQQQSFAMSQGVTNVEPLGVDRHQCNLPRHLRIATPPPPGFALGTAYGLAGSPVPDSPAWETLLGLQAEPAAASDSLADLAAQQGPAVPDSPAWDDLLGVQADATAASSNSFVEQLMQQVQPSGALRGRALRIRPDAPAFQHPLRVQKPSLQQQLRADAPAFHRQPPTWVPSSLAAPPGFEAAAEHILPHMHPQEHVGEDGSDDDAADLISLITGPQTPAAAPNTSFQRRSEVQPFYRADAPCLAADSIQLSAALHKQTTNGLGGVTASHGPSQSSRHDSTEAAPETAAKLNLITESLQHVKLRSQLQAAKSSLASLSRETAPHSPQVDESDTLADLLYAPEPPQRGRPPRPIRLNSTIPRLPGTKSPEIPSSPDYSSLLAPDLANQKTRQTPPVSIPTHSAAEGENLRSPAADCSVLLGLCQSPMKHPIPPVPVSAHSSLSRQPVTQNAQGSALTAVQQNPKPMPLQPAHPQSQRTSLNHFPPPQKPTYPTVPAASSQILPQQRPLVIAPASLPPQEHVQQACQQSMFDVSSDAPQTQRHKAGFLAPEAGANLAQQKGSVPLLGSGVSMQPQQHVPQSAFAASSQRPAGTSPHAASFVGSMDLSIGGWLEEIFKHSSVAQQQGGGFRPFSKVPDVKDKKDEWLYSAEATGKAAGAQRQAKAARLSQGSIATNRQPTHAADNGGLPSKGSYAEAVQTAVTKSSRLSEAQASNYAAATAKNSAPQLNLSQTAAPQTGRLERSASVQSATTASAARTATGSLETPLADKPGKLKKKRLRNTCTFLDDIFTTDGKQPEWDDVFGPAARQSAAKKGLIPVAPARRPVAINTGNAPRAAQGDAQRARGPAGTRQQKEATFPPITGEGPPLSNGVRTAAAKRAVPGYRVDALAASRAAAEKQAVNGRGKVEPAAEEAAGHATGGAGTGSKLSYGEIARQLKCPLSGVTMQDPVLAANGVTYERAAIEAHLRAHGTDPKTGLSMDVKLQANLPARQIIESLYGAMKPA